MVQHIGDHAADMVVLAGQAVDRATVQGLKAASTKSGVSFQYLLAKAAQESSLNPDAEAETSSAAGLFQFTRGTWLDMVKRYGSQYGFADLARQILETPSGKLTVTDAATEKRILALRQDPEASGLMAAQYARDNAATLKDALGRDPQATDLYLAHFLGPTGATALLNAATTTPARDAAAVVPAAAKANPNVFTTADGTPRTAADVVKLISTRFTDQLSRYAQADTVVSDAIPSTAAAATTAPTKPTATPLNLQLALGNTNQGPVNTLLLDQLMHVISAMPLVPADDSDSDSGQKPLASAGLKPSDFADEMTRAAAATPTGSASGAARVYNGPAAGPSKLDDLI
jgi:hypothetical protein